MEDYILYVESNSKCTSNHFETEATNPEDVSDEWTIWADSFGCVDY